MANLAKLAELRKLRTQGKTHRTLEFDENNERIYDEYDQREYEQRQRQRLREDDFVVDDDGKGYVDNGEYEWDQPQQYGDSESEGESEHAKRKHSKASKDETGRRDGDLTSMLRAPKKPKLAGSTPASSLAKPANTDVDAILNSVGTSKRQNTPKLSGLKSNVGGFGSGLSSGLGSRLGGGLGSLKFGLGGASRVNRFTAGTPTRRQRSFHEESEDLARRTGDDSFDADSGDNSMIGSGIIEPKQEISMAPVPLESVSVQPSEPSSELASEPDLSTAPINPTSSPNNEELDDDEDDEDDFLMLQQHVNNTRNSSPSNGSGLPTPGPSSDDVATGSFASNEWNLVAGEDNLFGGSGPTTANSTTTVKEGSIMRFFWTDYLEQGGGLVLFGKTVKGDGAAVLLRGIDRDLYLLPREDKSTEQVAEEMSMFFSKNGVPSLRSRKVALKNCFAKNKNEQTYLHVKAPYIREPVPKEGDTYSHCYGTTTNPIETFIIGKKIMGPCWLDVKVKAAANGVSWTGTSVECGSPAHVTVVPENESNELGVPKFTLMSLAITTVPNAKQNHEVVSISVRLYKDVDDSVSDATQLPSSLITGIRPPESGVFPLGFKTAVNQHNMARSKTSATQSNQVLVTHNSEKALLSWFFSLLLRVDPDILIGHSLTNVHLATLLQRALAVNETGWSKLGRFRQHSHIKKAGMQEVQRVCSGRLLVDLKNTFGMEIASRKCRDFTLEEMCREFLGQHRQPFDTNIRSGDWLQRGSDGLIDVVRRSEYDTLFVASIAFINQMLPLSRQLTQLAGNTWRATLFGTRSGRNDYLLMHEFAKNGFVIPDKPASGSVPQKHDNQFAGGQVFDPVAGLHQSCVLVMDFNSLYPSIIQEYNICFTTVDYDLEQTNEPEIPEASVPQGLLPRLLQTLVRRRQEVKKLMKSTSASPAQLAEWDIRQMALKLTANSMYGCLGLAESRFGARPLAQLVTMKGRQTLIRTKELAETNGMRVLYGDTDSVMIHTNSSKYSDAYAIGVEFKKLVNQQYRTMEIDIDHVFRRLLLYMKKKYAAVILAPDGKLTLEYKGLDLRRREFSDACKISSKQVLNLLFGLTGKDDFNAADVKTEEGTASTAAAIAPDEDETDTLAIFERVYEYLGKFSQDVRNNKLFPKMFVIRNQLSRDLDKYGKLDKPQLIVAQARMKAGYTVKSKDVISYIITKHTGDGNTAKPVPERAVSFEDLKKNELVPDYEWYLHHQVYTPISRFCEKIEGFDAERLAEVMGLPIHDKVVKNTNLTNSGSLFNGFEGSSLITLAPDADRFANCERLSLKFGDSNEFEFLGLSMLQPQGIVVPNTDIVVPYDIVATQLDQAIRSCITRYYNGWMECDECKCLTPSVSNLVAKRCTQPTCHGSLMAVYSSKDLYTQMCYFKSLFDTTRQPSNPDKRVSAAINSPRNASGLNMLTDVVARYIDRSGYSHINLGQYFVFK